MNVVVYRSLFNIYIKKFLKEEEFLDIILRHSMLEDLKYNVDLKESLCIYSKFFDKVSVNTSSGCVLFYSHIGHSQQEYYLLS